MDAIEKRAPNPNVAVIHEAMQHFPEGSWMRGALDHAAAELAVLHGRCQRAALTPPEGYVLVQEAQLRHLLSDAITSVEFIAGRGQSKPLSRRVRDQAWALVELIPARRKVP